MPLSAQVPADHPFVIEGRERLDVTDLAAQPLVVLTRDTVSRVLLDNALAARGLTGRIVSRTTTPPERSRTSRAGSGNT